MTSDNLRDAFRAFTTTVALITTNGPRGPNVMAAEWTFNISYRPFLIAVHIDRENVTHEEILATKEFGVNLVAPDLVDAMGFAGHYSKADADELSSELFSTVPATTIRAPMIEGCVLNAECRLVEHHLIGDHTMFVGEVVAFRVDPSWEPLILHSDSHRLGPRIERQPRIILAATPMAAGPGTAIVVHSEHTGAARAAKAVAVRVLEPGGAEIAREEAMTDDGGGFRVEFVLPPQSGPGWYAVVGSNGGVEGRARLEVRA